MVKFGQTDVKLPAIFRGKTHFYEMTNSTMCEFFLAVIKNHRCFQSTFSNLMFETVRLAKKDFD